jgi:hypothetical protein
LSLLSSDPDGEWSTLPSRKKKKMASAVKESGNFKLPIAGLGVMRTMATRKARRSGTSSPPTRKENCGSAKENKRDYDGESRAKMRVVTYLPPPMVPKKHVPEENDILSWDEDVDVHGVKDDDANALCSSSSPYDKASPLFDKPGSSSPPTSLHDCGDVPVSVDLTNLTARYPQTRAMMSQVRLLFTPRLFPSTDEICFASSVNTFQDNCGVSLGYRVVGLFFDPIRVLKEAVVKLSCLSLSGKVKECAVC